MWMRNIVLATGLLIGGGSALIASDASASRAAVRTRILFPNFVLESDTLFHSNHLGHFKFILVRSETKLEDGGTNLYLKWKAYLNEQEISLSDFWIEKYSSTEKFLKMQHARETRQPCTEGQLNETLQLSTFSAAVQSTIISDLSNQKFHYRRIEKRDEKFVVYNTR